MKSENDIRSQLQLVYTHRLGLRISRYERACCRNCVLGVERIYDLGEFGDYRKWVCGLGYEFGKCGCEFKCVKSRQDIERELLDDIRDPSVCGSKEPKIASLLWVLHDGSSKGVSSSSGGVESCVNDCRDRGDLSIDSSDCNDGGLVKEVGFWGRLFSFFRKGSL